MKGFCKETRVDNQHFESATKDDFYVQMRSIRYYLFFIIDKYCYGTLPFQRDRNVSYKVP